MRFLRLLIFLSILFVSNQSGAFQPAPLDTPVIVGVGTTGYPGGRKLVRDSRGYLYVVYGFYSWPFAYVLCARSTDNGRTWPARDTLNPRPPGPPGYKYWVGAGPSIAIDWGDTLYAVWGQEALDSTNNGFIDLFWAKNNGSGWTPARNLSQQYNGITAPYQNAVAVDSSGHPHAVWKIGLRSSITVVWYSFHDGVQWSPPEQISPDDAFNPSLVFDRSDVLHSTWTDYRDGWPAYRNRAGGIWGPFERYGQSFLLSAPQTIVVDSMNHPHVLFIGRTDTSSKSNDAYYTYRDSGGVWSAPLNLSNSGYVSHGSFSEDRRGNLYAVWDYYGYDTLGRLVPMDIYLRTYDGQVWLPPQQVSTAGSNQIPHLGYPVSDSGVDLIWNYAMPGGGPSYVVYLRLPLVGSGVEEGRAVPSPLSRLPYRITPNPFVSFAAVPGHEREFFALYDVLGRKVGIFKGDRIGLGVSAGIYFLKPEGQEAKPLRIVKLR